jgi:predicted hotdog family 3-hydroxylacyl-ACP dehydratase
MTIDRERIAALIPHAGAMCLLDRVLHWDQESIRCLSLRHRAADNPLRRAGRLAAICGIEFAAQAMAVHGRLAGGLEDGPRGGYLASLREVTCRQARLDLLEGELVIDARRLTGDERQAIYHFALGCAGLEVLSGRAAVVLDFAPP